jgi:hypothetical protein
MTEHARLAFCCMDFGNDYVNSSRIRPRASHRFQAAKAVRAPLSMRRSSFQIK